MISNHVDDVIERVMGDNAPEKSKHVKRGFSDLNYHSGALLNKIILLDTVLNEVRLRQESISE